MDEIKKVVGEDSLVKICQQLLDKLRNSETLNEEYYFNDHKLQFENKDYSHRIDCKVTAPNGSADTHRQYKNAADGTLFATGILNTIDKLA
jgi:hypothetical protein